MKPDHFLKLVKAELRAVFGRWSGAGALVLAVLVPLMAAFAMHQIMQATNMQANGQSVPQMLDRSWRGVLDWALTARHLFVMPTLLVLAGASTMAGELGDNTLREALLRPVPRVAVLLAKLAALWVLSAATLALTFVVAAGAGAAVAGTEADIGKVALAYGASWLSDFGLLSLTLLVSVFLRSVGKVLVVVILVLMSFIGLWGMLSLLGVFGVSWAQQVSPFLPLNGLTVWMDWEAVDGFDPRKWAALGLLVAVSLGGALYRFQRMDVP